MKFKKLMPTALLAVLLAGCTNCPKLADQKETVVKGYDQTTQSVFEDLYDQIGVDTAVKELLVQVANKVLADSEDEWTSTYINEEMDRRLNEHFKTFYGNATYTTDGLFDEVKLVQNLRQQGYNITGTNGAKETATGTWGYEDVRAKLAYDYTDYEEKLKADYIVDMLKEEYILSQRATATTKYFTNKDVRKVQYFAYTPENSTDATKFAQQFEDYITTNKSSKTFKEIVTGAGGLEEQWKLKKLEELAKNFALINAKAANGEGVCESIDYLLPSAYASKVKEYEIKYATDEKYGYRDIYKNAAKYDETEISEVRSKLSEFSNSGAQSIYKGYYEQQLAIVTAKYFTETVSTSDGSDLISSTVADKLEDMKENGYLDAYDTGSYVFKASSTYYVVYAEIIDDASPLADKKVAAKELAKISSNVKNAIYYYLTDLTEKGQLEINNQDVYDYLNATYSYGEKD